MSQKKYQKSICGDVNKQDLLSQIVNSDGLVVVKCFHLLINTKHYYIFSVNHLL